MKCGGCGSRECTLKAIKAEHHDGFAALRLTCTSCKSVTVLRPATPLFEVDHTVESSGTFCIGWHDEKSGERDE
jgi:MinD superfamily P-loop ATPase